MVRLTFYSIQLHLSVCPRGRITNVSGLLFFITRLVFDIYDWTLMTPTSDGDERLQQTTDDEEQVSLTDGETR